MDVCQEGVGGEGRGRLGLVWWGVEWCGVEWWGLVHANDCAPESPQGGFFVSEVEHC